MVEVQGLPTAITAANAAVQAASVALHGFGYLHDGQVMVSVTGSVSSVRAAVDAMAAAAAGRVRSHGVIASPDPQIAPVLAERRVPVGARVGAPRVPGRGPRFAAPRPTPAAPAAPAAPAPAAPEQTARRPRSAADDGDDRA